MILGIAGSVRQKSLNAALLRAAAELAPAAAPVEIASIRGIPLYDGDVEAAAILDAVAELKERVAQAEECLAFEGFMISFAGPLTRQGNALPEVARMLPLDRVLIETDSPYLVPQPLRARRNEPLFVKYVAEKLADIRGMTFEEIAQITTANAVRLFGLGEHTQ